MMNTEGNQVERRRYPRKEMSLIMEILESTGDKPLCNVLTNNISAGGVYFKTPHRKEFNSGQEMAVRIHMAIPNYLGKTQPGRIEGSGRVVREEEIIEGGEEKPKRWSGVALQFDKPLKMSF